MAASTSPRKIIDRKIRPLVEAALEDTRAVLIIGPRQAGNQPWPGNSPERPDRILLSMMPAP